MNNNEQKKSDKTLIIVLVCVLAIPAVLVLLTIVAVMVFAMLFIPYEVKKTNSKLEETKPYIEQKKDSDFIKYMKNYYTAAVTKVNEGRELQLYESDRIYLIPLGKDQCVTIEDEANSNYWQFAYAAVIYDAEKGSYTYYLGGINRYNQGIDFTTKEEIDKGTIKESYKLTSYSKLLKESYNSSEPFVLTEEEIQSDEMLNKLSKETNITNVVVYSKYCN